jgi:hypothetical protein
LACGTNRKARNLQRAASETAGMHWRHSARLLGLIALALVRWHAALAQTPLLATSADLCVTEGAVAESTRGQLTVTAPAMRAFAKLRIADAAETRFSYLGPSAIQSHLGSGAVREQFGLKLRAQDPCNLLYVMWRIAPGSRLVVQVKSNPAQHASARCSNHGYQTIKPRRAGQLPQLVPGEAHTLRARIQSHELRVWVDGGPMWQGEIGPYGAELAGPVGIRSDNVQIAFSLLVGPGPELAPAQTPVCRSGPEMAE